MGIARIGIDGNRTRTVGRERGPTEPIVSVKQILVIEVDGVRRIVEHHVEVGPRRRPGVVDGAGGVDHVVIAILQGEVRVGVAEEIVPTAPAGAKQLHLLEDLIQDGGLQRDVMRAGLVEQHAVRLCSRRRPERAEVPLVVGDLVALAKDGGAEVAHTAPHPAAGSKPKELVPAGARIDDQGQAEGLGHLLLEAEGGHDGQDAELNVEDPGNGGVPHNVAHPAVWPEAGSYTPSSSSKVRSMPGGKPATLVMVTVLRVATSPDPGSVISAGMDTLTTAS